MRERREKILSIPELYLMDFIHFILANKKPDAVLDMGSTLPADCELISVHHNYIARCFDAIVWHPSFDIVPDGEMAPPISQHQWRWEFPDTPIVI